MRQLVELGESEMLWLSTTLISRRRFYILKLQTWTIRELHLRRLVGMTRDPGRLVMIGTSICLVWPAAEKFRIQKHCFLEIETKDRNVGGKLDR